MSNELLNELNSHILSTLEEESQKLAELLPKMDHLISNLRNKTILDLVHRTDGTDLLGAIESRLSAISNNVTKAYGTFEAMRLISGS